MKNKRLTRNIIAGILFFLVAWFGILPILTGQSLQSFLKTQSGDAQALKDDAYGLIVMGSEPEGIAAAIAAARTGLKTLVITRNSDLGSYISSSMISQMEPDVGIIDGKRVILNRSIYQEIFGDLKIGFSTKDYIASVDRLTKAEKNLEILYNCRLVDVDLEGRILKGIHVQNQSADMFLSARFFIDATQDGNLLDQCRVPYTLGSQDINLQGVYMPLEYNFRLTGVDWEALNTISKTSDCKKQFKDYLLLYQRSYKRTKLVSPTFIRQNENELVITGLTQWGVDADNAEDVLQALSDAHAEALMLTAYMKSTFVAFKDARFLEGSREMFVPEYKHFTGRYVLTVEDILSDKNSDNKIALAGWPVDAGKFVDQGFNSIVTDPNVYAVPLGCIIPENVDNVLMTGSKASYRSLAATSAGHIPTRITVGESSGLTAAYCYFSSLQPSDLLSGDKKETEDFENYLKRGGIFLTEFNETIQNPVSKKPLKDEWVYPYLAKLTEYGLIAAGYDNDFRLDSTCSQDVFSVLLKNALVKMSPGAYSLSLDDRLKDYEKSERLSGETACEMLLYAAGIPFDKGKAFETAINNGLIPQTIQDTLTANGSVTMEVVYCLIVETAQVLPQ